MNFIRLKKIYGKAFRGLVEPFSVDLPEAGLVLIKGLNQNTSDSSDSGKSSLLLAIAHLFGGCPYPSTELQSFFTDEQYLVGAELEIGEQKIVVERSKGLAVKIDGKTIKGREAETTLDRLFGMDSSTRALVTYRGQGQPGLFLSMTDQEKKEFLCSLLGLDLYERIAEEATEKAAGYNKKLLELRTSVTIHRSNLYNFETQNPTMRACSIDETQNDLNQSEEALSGSIGHIKTEIETYESVIKDLTRELSVNKESYSTWSKECEKQLDSIRAEYKTNLKGLLTGSSSIQEKLIGIKTNIAFLKELDRQGEAQHEKEVAALKAAGQSCVARVKLGKEAEAQLQGLLKDKKQLDDSICFTCNRPWQSNDLSVQAQILEPKIRKCYSLIEDAATASREIGDLKLQFYEKTWTSNPEIAKLEQEAAGLQSEIQKQKDQDRVLISNNDAAEKQHLEVTKNTFVLKLHPLQDAVDQLTAKIEKHQKLIQSKRIAVRELEFKLESLGAMKRSYEMLVRNLGEVMKEYEAVLAQLNAENDLADLVGRKGFLGLIFDDVLAESAAAVNDILSNVANVRHVSFDFESEKESKNGSVQTRISPVVVVHGDKRPMASALSGGMKTAVQLAVDLGVGQVASQRCGSYPGWLILDESFDGLGKNSKESAIEMLQAYAKDRLVLIVDHSSEFQSLFAETIQMTSLDGRVTV